MLILFFNSKGVVHKEFVPECQMVTKEFYAEIVVRLLKRTACVRPAARKNHSFNLLHDNVVAHTAAIVQQF